MNINKVNFEDLKAACKAPALKTSTMTARINIVAAVLKQEIADYSAVIEVCDKALAGATDFNNKASTRLIQLKSLQAVFNETLANIENDKAINAGGAALVILHQQALIDVILSELSTGVLLRGLSKWHSEELAYDNRYQFEASPRPDRLMNVVQSTSNVYVRAVAFRFYA